MRSVILFLMLCGASFGLEVPERSKVGDFVTVKHEAGSFLKIVPERSASQRIEVDASTTVFTGVAGSYSLQEVFQVDGKWSENVATVVIGDQGPEPPNPPGPLPPDPEPPGPGPAPGPLSVVILYETGDPQPESIHSTKVRAYLNAHCPRGAGGMPAWRLWDDDYTPQQLADEDPSLVSMYSRAKAESVGRMPWILIQSQGKVASVPLPRTEAEVLDLLKKYGGA